MTIWQNGLYLGEIQPDLKIPGCIDVFENIWPNCEETIRSIEDQTRNSESGVYWKQAETLDQGVFQNERSNKVIEITHHANISNNIVCQNIHNQFYTTLLSTTIPYATRYGIREPLYHEGYNLIRYRTNERYLAHYDGNSATNRTISAILYLNADFKGGELSFPHFKFKILPRPGMLVLFPSNFSYLHEALPVTDGTKYALVTWIRDRSF